MEKTKKYWLNEYGERYWYKKSDITITAHRSYYWVDRVSFIKEGAVRTIEPSDLIPYRHLTTTDRKYLGDVTYTKFKEQIDEWFPIENYDDYTKKLKYEYEYRKYNL